MYIINIGISVVLSVSYQPTEASVLPISALKEQGLDELKRTIQEEIVKATGKQVLDLKVDLSSPQLRSALCTAVDIIITLSYHI